MHQFIVHIDPSANLSETEAAIGAIPEVQAVRPLNPERPESDVRRRALSVTVTKGNAGDVFGNLLVIPAVASVTVLRSEPSSEGDPHNPKCEECGGDLGGLMIGRLEAHEPGCSQFPL